MVGCQDESGECGQTKSHSILYVAEQNRPAVRTLLIQSASKHE